jgi:hypothetical protein
MKIWITTKEVKQLEIDIQDGCLIEISGPVEGRRRGPTDIIGPCGWISQQYDEGGLVTAIEIIEGDAFGRAVMQVAQVSPKIESPFPAHTVQPQQTPEGA